MATVVDPKKTAQATIVRTAKNTSEYLLSICRNNMHHAMHINDVIDTLNDNSIFFTLFVVF